MLEKRSRHPITSAADCEWLKLDFKTRADLSIGVNTLKRLLGFRKEDVASHHPSTLDVVANYLGYRCWKDVEEYVSGSASDFGHNPKVVNVDAMSVNKMVKVTYKPDRILLMMYVGHNTFKISETINSKLSVGDIVTIHQFALGHPLFVEEVSRNGISLGEYTAAKIGGLTSIDVY